LLVVVVPLVEKAGQLQLQEAQVAVVEVVVHLEEVVLLPVIIVLAELHIQTLVVMVQVTTVAAGVVVLVVLVQTQLHRVVEMAEPELTRFHRGLVQLLLALAVITLVVVGETFLVELHQQVVQVAVVMVADLTQTLLVHRELLILAAEVEEVARLEMVDLG